MFSLLWRHNGHERPETRKMFPYDNVIMFAGVSYSPPWDIPGLLRDVSYAMQGRILCVVQQ